ncbi:alanine--glyoxylate aminotransferase 2 [Anaeramoeba ignava]|uniref:alanine--glyoxylate transaminase n=1 Tax=Anaeramoeba ignava TaxID=1746090 RepID=A0A9Q0LF38_ANAIG|nr:alanine--glyoxylate aminotransferase 2 [Anaeramoeba ignava]
MEKLMLPPFDYKPTPYEGLIFDGKMQYVFDEKGERYLDCIAGICTVSVGHSHPKIIKAAKDQYDKIQHITNIYLHPNIVEYSEKLASKFPGNLKVCYFCNSGSEANEFAMQLARSYTGQFDIIALRNAYHGMGAAMDLTANAAWKQPTPHGFGIHHALLPDTYRGPFNGEDAGEKYAQDVEDLIGTSTCGKVAGFICEPIQGVGGVIEYPPDYLKRVYEIVRKHGGLCIADEVQTGFGRTGDNYWGFQNYGVIPDIVTMAKGIGNGAPLAAVVTTPEIAQSITKKHHFNTFGGNPISMAIGKAVLEVIDEENIQEKAKEVGGYLHSELEKMREKHKLIGKIRGRGLMCGIDLVEDQKTKKPATTQAGEVMEKLKDLKVLIGKGGLFGNILRIKPPMCITKPDINYFIKALDVVLDSVEKKI